MRIVLILTILSALTSIVHPKTEDERQTCFDAIAVATTTASATTDSTGCSACLNNCMTGDLEALIFNGYGEDCVNKCDCPGAYAAIQTVALTDICKSAFKLISFTGIMLALLISLLI